MDDVLALMKRVELNDGASEEEIAAAEEALGRKLPADYRAFLLRHDGGEGFFGDGEDGEYGRFEPVAELADAQSDEEHLDGCLVFGSSGGGEAYVFDEAGQVLSIPWVGDREAAVPQGDFASFVRRLADGRLLER